MIETKGVKVIGDLHIPKNKVDNDRKNECKFVQCQKFIEWFIKSEHNDSEYDGVFLGDIFDVYNPDSDSISLFMYFLMNLKFKHIYIITGNHDRNPSYNILDIVKSLDKCTVIDTPTLFKLNDVNCLALPHMDSTLENQIGDMFDYYNEYLKTINSDEINFVFHHLETDESHFGEKYVDLTKFRNNPKCFIVGGHVHSETVSNGGGYLGSVVMNSSSEKNDTKYIGHILYEDCSYTPIKIPKFMKYVDLIYPNETEINNKNDVDDEIPIVFSVSNAPTKKEAEDFYNKLYESKLSNFCYRRITTSLIEELENNNEEESSINTENYIHTYCVENNISNSIESKIMEIVN